MNFGEILPSEFGVARTYHIEEDAKLSTIVLYMGMLAPVGGAKAPRVFLFANPHVFCVDKEEIDPQGALAIGQLACNLKQHSYATCCVVSTQDRFAFAARVGVVIRYGASIPVCQEQDTTLCRGVEASYYIGNREGNAFVG